ncbi:MAG: hypothetical protein ACK47B_07200 [Armatimonadota bacterium]
MTWLLALVASSALSVVCLAFVLASHARAYLRAEARPRRQWGERAAFILLPLCDCVSALALAWFVAVPAAYALVLGLLFCIASLRLTEGIMRFAEEWRLSDEELAEARRRHQEEPRPGMARRLGQTALTTVLLGGARTLLLALGMLLVAAALHG